VYLFTRTLATPWTQQVYVKASNADADDRFGRQVALVGNVLLVVGAPLEDSAGDPTDNTATESGAAYAFSRTGSTWSEAAIAKAVFPIAGDQFGNAVAAASNGTIVVGAWNRDGRRGAVYILER
jgi:hypothetical protein